MITFREVKHNEKRIFLKMVSHYFKELNPEFVPCTEWKENYYESLVNNKDVSLVWIIESEHFIGFIIFCIHDHFYLNKKIGFIQEFFVIPEHRKKGIGSLCAKKAIETLRFLDVYQIKLDIMSNNEGAKIFWEKLGFKKISERYNYKCEE